MGFDIYGLNPQMNEVKPAILAKPLNWSKMSEKETELYLKAKDEHQEINPGEYFRANVWFWRPIWNFVCAACDDFLLDADMDAGDSNSGDKISKTKANKIASRLRKLEKQGIIQTWEDEMLIPFNDAKEHNKKIDAELHEFQNKMSLEYGVGTAPNEYNADDKKEWDSIYKERSWAGSYPPSASEITKFGIFCGESGGFQIC